MRNLYYILCFLFLLPFLSNGQINVNTNLNDNDLIQTLGGSGVTITNVTVNGVANAYGQFTNGGTLGINQGVILTSGTIQNAVGPNNLTNQSATNNGGTSAILNALGQGTTQDACEIRFTIIPEGSSISFNYVFGSEEYHEYVNSQFNDVFGFFISGPGINGNQNMALIPNTTIPVAINTVNNGFSNNCAVGNTQLFVDNCGGPDVEYDGHTRVFSAFADNLIPCRPYQIILAIGDVGDSAWDSGAFIQQGSFTSDNSIVDFHFEHEDGTEDTEFNLCEDVYLDGSATANTGSYFLDIWKVNNDGTVSWISQQAPNGWATGQPDLINITDLFTNNGNPNITFQVGMTYEVKLAVNDPFCGWVSKTHRFTITTASMSSLFDIEYVCHDGVYDIILTGDDPVPTNQWNLYEVESPGDTSGGDLIGQQLGDTVTFTNLDPTGNYYIKHGVYTTNCPWQETRLALDPPCCDQFTTADFSVTTKCFEGTMSISVSDFNLYDDLDATHEWYILSSENQNGGPYTPVFSTTSTGPGPIDLISGLPDNLHYLVFHKVKTYCGELCFAEVVYCGDPFGNNNEDIAQSRAVEIDCCLVFEFWPNGPGEPMDFTAFFSYSYDSQNGSITVANFETYDNANATHTWYIIKSEDPILDTNDTVILTIETTGSGPITLITGLEQDYFYFIVHKVTTECGEVCYADVHYDGVVQSENRAEIDCSIVDEIIDEPCSELTAPTNLQVNGTTLSWDPVPGAIGYIVRSPGGLQIDCGCELQISMAPQQTTETSLVLTGALANSCFVWMVIAICGDETQSQPSQQACYGGGGIIGDGGHKSAIETVSITPNPTYGILNFNIQTSYDSPVTVEMYNFFGVRIKTLTTNTIAHKSSTITWDGSNLVKGVYFVIFKTDKETIQKRVIIK